MKEEIGNRIKEFREKLNISQADFGQKIGLSFQHISKYERGEVSPSTEVLAKICEIYNANINWLLIGEGSVLRTSSDTYGYHEKDEYEYISMATGKIGAGGSLIADARMEIRLAFRKDWIRRKGDPRNMSLIQVQGDSMEDTLFSGDIVLVDHSRNYVDYGGGIYVIAIGDSIMVKRLQIMIPQKKLKIISDNKKYDAMEVDPEEIVLNGKVIWFGREIER